MHIGTSRRNFFLALKQKQGNVELDSNFLVLLRSGMENNIQ